MVTGSPRPPAERGRRRGALALVRPVLTATALVVVYYLWPLERPSGVTLGSLALGLAALVLLLAWQVRAVATSTEPRRRAVEALATSISLFVVLFAGFYAALSESDPGAFTEPLSRTDALYFTVTTLATVGFGDVAALAQPARVAVTVQMVSGLLLLGAGVKVVLGAAQAGLAQAGQARAARPPRRSGAGTGRDAGPPPRRDGSEADGR